MQFENELEEDAVQPLLTRPRGEERKREKKEKRQRRVRNTESEKGDSEIAEATVVGSQPSSDEKQRGK